tara:strand:- start:285 stop:971 length:687 start_codon:yes stop_codon:yes gene_type:complete
MDTTPEETHKMKLLQQRLKIQKEHERIFSRHFRNEFIKYINECFSNPDCEIERVYDIYTTRFTSDTYYQNVRYKQNIKCDGSLYSTMLTFPVNTPDKLLFVLDMNNTTNKIVGIGLVRNILAKNQDINIYSNPGFNNYVYKSAYYVSLMQLYGDSQASVEKDNSWLKYIEDEFEARLFYGKSHSKRGGSFMVFPRKFKQRKHLLFLVSLFVLINPNHFVENVMNKTKF